ncbi:MAG: DUF523 domain-containing protein [Pseudomonadota bacterium]|nr:hypothetical protein [Pseudomonadales bacterium]MDY6920930.1 DUF523 domain-containing protein [Pseudomonadota bacterium]
MSEQPLVGISSCLTGMAVRYDGRHKYQSAVMAAIAPKVRLLPLCPESMAGMGIPRGPVNLIEQRGQIRARGRDDPERDVTERLLTMGRIVARTYPDLCGYVLQSRSPSCGFGSTPIWNADQSQMIRSDGHGLFVSALLKAFPDLPLLDDRQLDPGSIARFLTAVRERAEAIGSRHGGNH